MAEKKSLARRWDEFQPSKTAMAWTAVGAVVAVVVVGFTWGGWVTGGTANEMARRAALDAQADLAAAVCVHQFAAGDDARTQLASLKDLSSYRRGRFVEDGGWATMPGADSPLRNVGSVCADRLIDLQLPEVAAAGDEATAPVEH